MSALNRKLIGLIDGAAMLILRWRLPRDTTYRRLMSYIGGGGGT